MDSSTIEAPSSGMAAPHQVQAEYDLVFAGGGVGACITASRLASAFPGLSIAIFEKGASTKDKMEHIQPGRYLAHLAPTSTTVTQNISKPSEYLNGRSAVVGSGCCVGGGSDVNWVMYNRPAASDFDDWEKSYGNVGWSAKDLIPMLQKAETYEIDPTKPTHGSDGPLKVSFGGSPIGQVGKEFIEIGPKFQKDRPGSDEGNALDVESINKFFAMPKWASSKGRRSDVAHNYIYKKHPKNLSVFDGCLVNRVVIENGVAIGVEYLWDNRVHKSSPQDIYFVKARKLVIVSAWSMGSPLILERSGIGKKDILTKAGIPVIIESTGVGHAYQDHGMLLVPYLSGPQIPNWNGIYRGEAETWAKAIEQLWEKDGSGPLGTNGIDGNIKMRPRPEELDELGPEFTKYWNESMANHPDKPLFLSRFGTSHLMSPSCAISLAGIFSQSYPVSRGHLHISSSDPYAAPDFVAGFLSSPLDVLALRWAYKRGRELMRRLPSFRGISVPGHPKFSQNSAAAVVETDTVSLEAPNIVYSAEDDRAIDTYVRQIFISTWHSLGTCPMKPFEQGGVVDSNLNVYGVKGLKVADLSIPPSNVNSNTYSTAIAVGEKAAVIIAEEFGGSV
ncbi:hypothetical protein DFH06DRAFT_1097750 [Mycena polygramma]|nr:hypothetical protein DFH06DRAFT_1097750 [Mycena polygramma]